MQRAKACLLLNRSTCADACVVGNKAHVKATHQYSRAHRHHAHGHERHLPLHSDGPKAANGATAHEAENAGTEMQDGVRLQDLAK